MIMQHPVPFGAGTLDNSPLKNAKPGSAGSDYPCKQRAGVYDIDTINDMAVGSSIELNFTGSASHGGGTCQIAVSLDQEPKAESAWKVIQVYEGGCPTTGDGNTGSDNFTFQIPKGFPNGRFTLSWTWYNKIGNREVYQNCAPIQITGGSASKEVYESLPNLYLINLPTSECSTVETTDLEIPVPGQSILKDSSVIKGAVGPSCAASAAAQTAGTSGHQTGAPQGHGSSSQAASPTAPGYGGAMSFTSSSKGSYAAPTTMVTMFSSTAAEASVSYPTLTLSSGAGISGPASATNSAPIPLSTGSSYGGTEPLALRTALSFATAAHNLDSATTARSSSKLLPPGPPAATVKFRSAI
ncbi:unnamed protein product [Zymoseptoria tritici ST99CH_3D7]|uniref:Chitin-binding type-4 domain-containing protein n=1 Tax=Zymoseptoria tritici (strain ST99CH_3D7) TaxID=1276538 RepID=A0A1X7RH95_ZYMT9|nr:unnamed protein product [Zymoseptoria tritici ST99CH_3D7]